MADGDGSGKRGARARVFTFHGERHFVVVRPSRDAPLPRPTLTQAQRAVLLLVAEGLTNEEIAKRRGTSTRTVANQVASLLRLFNCTSRVELGVIARANR